jgi:hypothetical protein
MGTVTALREAAGEQLADCDIWLQHSERGVLLEGEACVALGGSAD